MNLLSKMSDFLKTWILPPGFYRLARAGKEGLASYGANSSERVLLRRSDHLKGRHENERCFILGAGSSIKKQDLKKLRGEIVISVSNTFVHPDFPLIRPQYHVLPHLLQGHGRLKPESEFVAWLSEMERLTFDAEMFMHIGDKKLIDRHGLFKERNVYWVEYCGWDGNNDFPVDLARVPRIWSVSELAITVALHLGFKEIYLLGIDHDWFNGLFVYFYDHTKDHAMKPDEAKVKTQIGADAEFQMRRHADIFRKYKYLYSIKRNIFNANADPNHYLDVFPKVEFDSLFGQEGKP